MYKLGEQLGNDIIFEEIVIPQEEVNAAIGKFVVIKDVFVGRTESGFVAYDRVCNHNGGQLVLNSDNSSAICPHHAWVLNLSRGVYENGCSKKSLPIRLETDKLIVIRSKESFPRVPTEGLTNSDINFKFNAHASVSIEIDNVNIISDPWFVGSCFANGWWHAYPPSLEAIDRLTSSDFIYISHNHPDHLHIPTLEKYVDKSKLLIIPNFHSKSVENLLRRIGFENLIVCDFMRQIRIDTKGGGVTLIVVKSGDDRDDSSLLLYTANRKVFLAVDTNMPNNWVLPKVDVLFTPFASGASGFPVRVENFDLQKKIEIINSNRLSVLNNHVSRLVGSTMPDYVVPYAGYFTEIHRDNDVKVINVKNSPQDLISFVEERFPGVKGINPIDNPCFKLGANGLRYEDCIESPAYFLDEHYISSVISEGFNGAGGLSIDELTLAGEKFISSAFFDNLTVVFVPSDDSIMKDLGCALVIDFSIQNRSAKLISINGETDSNLASIVDVNNNNLELLRVRADSLAMVVRGGLPLEDLSIGFQIKMYRQPNVYNFNFWDYFTNKEFVII